MNRKNERMIEDVCIELFFFLCYTYLVHAKAYVPKPKPRPNESSSHRKESAKQPIEWSNFGVVK
ncbi:unnamed protein product [Anisakis simplex]|uniref:Secreted protein n=1 Tax=Anisakis simplex TaxID=6269 RepID=A0A0M3K9X5_ANISI|nr:unnamed protein product [Anisakis simplex]